MSRVFPQALCVLPLVFHFTLISFGSRIPQHRLNMMIHVILMNYTTQPNFINASLNDISF